MTTLILIITIINRTETGSKMAEEWWLMIKHQALDFSRPFFDSNDAISNIIQVLSSIHPPWDRQSHPFEW